ncbi:MAG TPA: CoA pyrophosphatase, partial [Vicinamibacteria bacterium]|nr:CoA pyrophosphatase [Vicinamibacteria bacterium]
PSHEVVSLHWLPLERLLAKETRSTLLYQHEETPLELPCLRIEGLVIWGLTYKMFDNLHAVLESG